MRERILHEAILLIQQKGFTFTLLELSQRLGTSKRTIYEHFTSKDQMIGVIIEKVISEIKEKEKAISESSDIELLEKIKQILVFSPKNIEIMDIRLLSDLKKHHYQQWVELDYFIKKEWTVVLHLMEQGISQGIIRPINVQAFIELYLGALNQIYDPSAFSSNQQTIGERLQNVVDILLNGISHHKEKEK
ncbi:TetR family transcriptional regulator [Bacillus benzoevorans]|uniref:AcrR family transcriptional regulator n=1 Tax=Bacillus benzoevorans TaxID=1456 RepID=A0A7X0HTY5_9BACI|nr:AcrR family transcriptional regulator [Bacillus benzoevorans]